MSETVLLPNKKRGDFNQTNRPLVFTESGGSGQLEGWADFDWSSLAVALGEIDKAEAADEARQIGARFAIAFVRSLVSARHNPQAIASAVIALGYTLGLVDEDRLEKLAAPLGLTKQGLGKLASGWRDKLGTVAAAMKSERARQAYRASARDVHRRRKEGLLS